MSDRAWFEVLGGRKFTLAILLALLTTALAAFGKFTTEVAGVFMTIYGGYAYANSKVTTSALAAGKADP